MGEMGSDRVTETSWRKNKGGGDVEFRLIQGIVSAVLGKGLPVCTTRCLMMVLP
jgi:hypothetical protein